MVYIKINDLEDVPIRCIVYQTSSPSIPADETDSSDVVLDDQPEIPPSTWKFSFNEPIFEDQREQLYMLPRHRLPEVLTSERRRLAAASEYRMSVDEVITLVNQYSEWKDKRDKVLYAY